MKFAIEDGAENTLQTLPKEILIKIFSVLCCDDWLRLMAVCKDFKMLIQEADVLWRRLHFFKDPTRQPPPKGDMLYRFFSEQRLIAAYCYALELVKDEGMRLLGISQVAEECRLQLLPSSHRGNDIQIDDLESDHDLVLAAVRQDWCALHFASKALKNDREIVLAAVRQDGLALQYASMALEKDRDFILAAVQQNGRALRYASAALKKDRDFILAAVQQDGFALSSASAALKNDRVIVLAAVQQNGLALQFASDRLRADSEIVEAAVQQNLGAAKYSLERSTSDSCIL